MNLTKRLLFLFSASISTSLFGQKIDVRYYDRHQNPAPPKNSYYFSTGKKNKQGIFCDSVKSYYTKSHNLKSVEIRDKFGNPIGDYESFYPNGVLKLKGRYERKPFKLQSSPDSTTLEIQQFNDSIGNQQVRNWNGFLNDRLEVFLMKGKIVNGLKDSVWTIFCENGKVLCHESWHEGELVDGISYDAGHDYYYKAILVLPEPSEGDKEFYHRMSDEMNYPKEAERRGIEGKVIVEFTVEKDGIITNPKVLKGMGFGCNEEAIRVVSLSRPWKPALQRGQAIKYTMVIPFVFKLK